MRYIVSSIGINFALGFALGLAILGIPISISMLVYGEDITLAGNVFMTICLGFAFVLYPISAFAGLVWGILWLEKHPNTTVRRITRASREKITQSSTVQITKSWYQAIHEKTCPSITFTD
jgi:cytochrome bd-type quinol oxidase subunit 2